MRAELPVNEIMRIKALHDLAILDSPREQSFDDVAQIAMQLCGMPIAVVSLIDNDRQWFKSCIGLDATETPRDVAFCAHAILSPSEVMVVEDATKDLRFFDNYLVTSAPFIRFYAGAPLVDENGFALGTLCVIDHKPCRLSDGQLGALKALARQVINLLRLKTTNEAMRHYASRMQLIADTAPVLIGEIDLQHQYIFNNKKYAEWFKGTHNLDGKKPSTIFSGESLQRVQSAINEGLAGKNINIEITTPDNRVIEMRYLPHKENNKVIGIYEIGTDVTERTAQSLALQKERERLTAIIEGTNIGTWEWNLQTGGVIFNERWGEMLGYSLEELQPLSIETWARLMHPDDLATANTLLEKHFSGATPFFDCEFRMLKKNGEWQWLHSHGKVGSYTPDGKPRVMSGMHADIGAIKHAYNRLKDSEDLLHSMLSNFPGAAYRRKSNADSCMHYLSSAVYQLTGYAVKDFMGDVPKITFLSITHPEDIKAHNEKILSSLMFKEPFAVEYRIKRADGKWRRVQELGRGIYNENDDLEFIDGFIWDITEHYETEKAKKVMGNKMDSLYELAPVGIALNRLSDGHFIEANPEIFRMVGYTQEELRHINYWDITPIKYAASEAHQLETLKATGRYGPYEKHYTHKDGRLIPVVLSGVRIESETGEEQIWSIVQDITEQKRVERMKNEFISTVSHELRTPLTSISGSLGLITNSMLGVIPEKIQSMLGIAYKNSQRLTLLIDDLLDMEKLVAGKMDFQMQVQTILPVIEQAVIENKSYADKYSVRYVIDDKTLGAVANVDAFRLQQVLNNFLSNAAKYSPKDCQVNIVLEYVNEDVRITVRDYGSGIPEEFKTRIFQKFSQADSSDTRQKGGTGLGLAISKELVERMGGNIGFDSGNAGSAFYAEFKKAF